eukprot:COSAG04_NODE_3682_length_2608_cov_3.504982_3_plen_197_part_00
MRSPKPKKWEELQRLDWLLRVQSPSPKKKPEAHAEVRRSPDRFDRCVLAARLRWLACGVQAEREYAGQMQQETAEEAARRQRAQRHAMRARLRAAADSSNPQRTTFALLADSQNSPSRAPVLGAGGGDELVATSTDDESYDEEEYDSDSGSADGEDSDQDADLSGLGRAMRRRMHAMSSDPELRAAASLHDGRRRR